MQSNPKTNQRQTVKHLVQFVTHGNIVEIAKIMRRRAIHGGRLLASAYFHLFGFYYYNPRIQKRRARHKLERLLLKTLGIRLNDSTVKPHRIALVMRDGDVYPKSSAFIRLILPLTTGPFVDHVSLRLYSENTASLASDTTVCIVQRTVYDTTEQARQLVAQIRQLGITLIVDTDDAFHGINQKHPEYKQHTARLDAFNYLVSAADQLWLSTPALATYFKDSRAKTTVVVNSLDERLWLRQRRTRKANTGPLQLLYTGTVSHDADFGLIFPALDMLAQELPGSFRLTVIGVTSDLPDRPWLKRSYQRAGFSIYARFVPWLLKQGPFDIGLSPLVDTDFNAGKSDIKCLDYFGLGAVPVVSDVEPYAGRELNLFIIRTKNTTQYWQATLRPLLEDPAAFRVKRAAMVRDAQTYLWQKRSTIATAKKLFSLLTK